MACRCRDCGLFVNALRPASKCPNCGSIYLLSENRKIQYAPEKGSIRLGERFVCLALGAVFGLITFALWGIAALLKGGPGAAKAAAGAFYVGCKLSLGMAVCIGVIGFLVGGDRLARVLGIMWGTDRQFNENLENRFHSMSESVPRWLVYSILGILIAGSFIYLRARLA